ncbi:MAG: hypothetical protein ABSD98_07640, partial [Candidatus Korobacteraceae bacterium]
KQAAQRRHEVSPARKRRVEWEIEPSRGAAARFSRKHFSRAEKPFIFAIPSGLQAARDLLFRRFQWPVKGVLHPLLYTYC